MKTKLRMIFAMTLFGTLSLFVRNIPLTSGEISLFRAVIALLCLTVYKLAKREKIPLRGLGRESALLFLSGAAMGFNWIFLFEAYRYTTVSVATLSYYFAPVIVMVASPLLFHEKMKLWQVICFVGSSVGLVLVINPTGLNEGAYPVRGVLFGLAAAALYAMVILLNKGIRRVSGIDRTMLQFAFAVIVLLPYLLLTAGIHMQDMTTGGWLCLLAVGVLHSGVGYVMYFSSLKVLPGQEAAILSYIDPLVAVIVSLTILHEPVSVIQLAGGAMILAFTLANERRGT